MIFKAIDAMLEIKIDGVDAQSFWAFVAGLGHVFGPAESRDELERVYSLFPRSIAESSLRRYIMPSGVFDFIFSPAGAMTPSFIRLPPNNRARAIASPGNVMEFMPAPPITGIMLAAP